MDRIRASGDVEVSTYLEIAKEKGGEAAQTQAGPRPTREGIAVIDFGSQYSQLIARRVRECQVYCELIPYDAPWEKVASLKPKGFILSGGPASVYESEAPQIPSYIFESRLPVLGICYGLQALTQQLGGKVIRGEKQEYGQSLLYFNDGASMLFADLPQPLTVWMSHGDCVGEIPSGFRSLAYTENCPVAAMGNDQGILGIQFHPEVAHTPQGKTILKNFLYGVCGCAPNWTPINFATETVDRFREQVGTGKVICALSGGVDSSVVATLLHRAVGEQLT
ncbi:MAG: glutamine-hydrolyzing GMP synthase, partial [Chloroflexota bacterium]